MKNFCCCCKPSCSLKKESDTEFRVKKLYQNQIENLNKEYANLNERERNFENKCAEKEKYWEQKEKDINKKMDEINQFQKEKTVFKTVEKNLKYANQYQMANLKLSTDYNYKGEKLNEKAEACIIERQRPNNYLTSGIGYNNYLLPFN